MNLESKQPAPPIPPASQQPVQAAPSPKGFPWQKLVLIGVPVFLVQVVVVYFLIARGGHSESTTPKKEDQEGSEMFVIKDLLVNPAGTNGTRFLLTTVGFEVPTPEAKQELEKREVQLRDMLIRVLANKGLDDLVSTDQRETIRKEITSQTRVIARTTPLTNVYFSKFVIQ